MGLFDIASPLLGFVDGLFAISLSPAFRVFCWGGLMAVLSMWLYCLFSAQKKIERMAHKVKQARQVLIAYEGDFSQLIVLVKASLLYSLKHMALVLLPALLASLPLLFVLVWLSNVYSFSQPAPETQIEVCIKPDNVAVHWTDMHAWQACSKLQWPEKDRPLVLRDKTDHKLLTIPLVAPVEVVHKKLWWNVLVANPAGYLAADAKVDKVLFRLPAIELISLGPLWMRSWLFVFFSSLVIFSLFIKFVFKIR